MLNSTVYSDVVLATELTLTLSSHTQTYRVPFYTLSQLNLFANGAEFCTDKHSFCFLNRDAVYLMSSGIDNIIAIMF